MGLALGAVTGAFLGNLLCFGYGLWYGPFLPQAGVDPQPAGWVGWWLGGGAVAGALLGLVVSLLILGAWRLVRSPRRD